MKRVYVTMCVSVTNWPKPVRVTFMNRPDKEFHAEQLVQDQLKRDFPNRTDLVVERLKTYQLPESVKTEPVLLAPIAA